MPARFPALALLVALAACAPVAQTAPPTPPPSAGTATAQVSAAAQAPAADGRLVAGPMLADVTHRTARVWVQTDGPAEVQLAYMATATDDPTATLRPVVMRTDAQTTRAEDAHTATFRLSGLEPGWTYAYTVAVDGATVETGYATEIRTQPLWQYRTDPPAFTVAFGSCYFDNDAPYDRPGRAYGGPTGIFGEIDALGPDLMLWLGDNNYLREVDWWSPEGIQHRYTNARRAPDLQPLLASAAHYAVWDDHDYGPNDSDRSYVLKDHALATHADFWPNPTHGWGGVPGVFTQFQWADVEFFLLDNRYHRAPNRAPEAERTILGEAQTAWLIDALTASRAPFKVVVMGGQMLNPVPVFETYVAIAPAERAHILDTIHERRIEGVVFLSGDRHHGELMRMERDGAYPLVEFTSSPLTAGAVQTPRDAENPIRVPGTLIAGTRNFGTLTVSGERTDREMAMRAYSADGALLWEHRVRARELQYPRD